MHPSPKVEWLLSHRKPRLLDNRVYARRRRYSCGSAGDLQPQEFFAAYFIRQVARPFSIVAVPSRDDEKSFVAQRSHVTLPLLILIDMAQSLLSGREADPMKE